MQNLRNLCDISEFFCIFAAEKGNHVMRRLLGLLMVLSVSLLVSVHVVAQTENDGARLSGTDAEAYPVDLKNAMRLDSVHLRTEMMRPYVEMPRMPVLQNYTLLTKQGEAGVDLWRGAHLGFYGATDLKLGLITTETGVMTLQQNVGRWQITASAIANKDWMPWQQTLSTQYGVGGTVSYKLNDKVTLNAFGYYYANQMMVGPAMNPYMKSSTFGGFADIRFSDMFGADVGVRRYLNPMTGKWTTEPIVNPYIKLGNGRLTMPLGNILKELIKGREDDPRQFRPHPMSHPEVKRR